MPFIIAAVILVAGIGLFAAARAQSSRSLAALRAAWGQPTERDRDMAAIAGYHRTVNAGSHALVDDRTWNDLDMDDVFAWLDRTHSVVGQQVLYARLRTIAHPDRNAVFEAIVMRLSEDQTTRERVQLALGRLSSRAGYDLWRLTQPQTLAVERWYWLFPVVGVAMALAALAAFTHPPMVLALLAGAMGGLVVRTSIAGPLRVVTGAFRELGSLLSIAEMFAKTDLAASPIWVESLRTDVKRLSRLKRVAAWASRDSTGAMAGDLMGIVFEYLNLVFWLDANALFFGARELKARGQELLRVIGAVGEIDAAVAIASYRAGTHVWTRPILRPDGPIRIGDAVHPLLPDAVPNSAELAPPHGIVITGSNMSGKSTFLRTAGLSVLMAQTINTCAAGRFEGPAFVIRTCIGRADDLLAGKSYYLAEVEAVLSLVRSAMAGERHLLLFDELFRGTNAVERIAAGEAVLRALLKPGQDGRPAPHVILAATHDHELVDLLAPVYAAYHFTDTIDSHGLSFDYTLKPGIATTRNAIALLAHCGAAADLVEHARSRADAIDRSRRQTLGG